MLCNVYALSIYICIHSCIAVQKLRQYSAAGIIDAVLICSCNIHCICVGLRLAYFIKAILFA